MLRLLVRKSIFGLFLFFTLSVSMAAQSTGVEGAWALISKPGESTEPMQYKIWNDGHFIYMRKGTDQGSASMYGTYRVEGNKLIETAVHTSDLKHLGWTVTWTYRMQGDLMVISGPVAATNADGTDAMGEIGGGKSITEYRMRL